MSGDVIDRRRAFAEELGALCHLPRDLVEAFASVPRERFLRPGPWTIRGDGDSIGGSNTSDADPRHVYQNVSVAIDPGRQLYNGQPGTLAAWIAALDVAKGNRVLHVGCGLGYYSAVLAQAVGPQGRVLAVEVDAQLAAEATSNLASTRWVEVRHGDGTGPFDERFDAVLVNAGVTHPERRWLDALAPRGRLIVPLTCSMAQMGTIGKGFVFLIADQGDDRPLSARVLRMVAIYSAVGIRDASANARLGTSMMNGLWARVTELRRDVHEHAPTCWLHLDGMCLSAAP